MGNAIAVTETHWASIELCHAYDVIHRPLVVGDVDSPSQ